MRFECGSRQSVVAELDQRASAGRFEQELHRRLPRPQAFDATPGKYHFGIWNDLQVGPSDGNAMRTRDTEYPAGPGIGLDDLGEPSLHLGRLRQECKHCFGQRIDADFKSNLPTLTRVVHFLTLLRSAASAAAFNRCSRGPQYPLMNLRSSSKPSCRTT